MNATLLDPVERLKRNTNPAQAEGAMPQRVALWFPNWNHLRRERNPLFFWSLFVSPAFHLHFIGLALRYSTESQMVVDVKPHRISETALGQ